MEDDESDSDDPTFNASDFPESDESEYDNKKAKKLTKRKKRRAKKRMSAKGKSRQSKPDSPPRTLEDKSPPASKNEEENIKSPPSIDTTQEGDESNQNGKESGENGQSTTLQQQLNLLKIDNPEEAEIIQKPEDGHQQKRKGIKNIEKYQALKKKEKPDPFIALNFVTKNDHQYTIAKKLGNGCFGCVYAVKNQNDELFALKTARDSDGITGLIQDCRILKLVEAINSQHFCKFVHSGHLEEKFYYLVLTLVGKSLFDVLKDGVSVATKIIFCKQTFECLRDLHKIGYIHYDIKDDNFAIGQKPSSNPQAVYIIDFGLSMLIKEDGKKATKERPTLPRRTGNVENAAISSLEYIWPSRNDDMESNFYMTVKWFGFKVTWSISDSDEEMIQKKKEFWSNAAIQEIRQQMPTEISEAFVQIYSLINGKKWGEMPEYDKISEVLETTFQELTKSQPHKLEWMANEPYQEPKKSESGEINPRYRIPYFQHSRKKDGHYNVIVKGEVYNYKAHLKKEREGKIVARYKCKNHHRCNRTLLVGNYDKEKVENDDEAEIQREKGREDNPHACELKENGTSEETAWDFNFFNS
uniref:Protein kinase domain-containing protein n=1 Tax=Panagrolaimus sp. ES5 TaxID=591445 RepID=A0AC34FX21_9BILA